MPKYKKLKWSKHAKKRFKERGLVFDHVCETVEDPDISYPSKDEVGRMVYRKTIKGRFYFVVVVEESNEEATIITIA